MTVYGIPSCDITRKAISALKKKKMAFEFHDYRQSGITAEKLKNWIDELGLDKILNKKSTTWRSLPPESQAKINSLNGAIQLMLEHNTLIKRPIIERDGKIIVGFDEHELQRL